MLNKTIPHVFLGTTRNLGRFGTVAQNSTIELTEEEADAVKSDSNYIRADATSDGSPEGVVLGHHGKQCWDRTNSVMYVFDAANGLTGWRELIALIALLFVLQLLPAAEAADRRILGQSVAPTVATQLSYTGGTNLVANLTNSNSVVFYATLTNTAHISFSNLQTNLNTITFHLKQDATGGRAITWAGNVVTVPTLSTNANAMSIVMLIRSPFVSTNFYALDATAAAASSVVSDTAFAASYDSVTGVAPSKNAFYDWAHTFDTDDDGKPNVLDIGAGVPKTDSNGVVSVATAGTDYTIPGDLAPAFTTLTDGATITWTVSARYAVQNATVTLGGNRTLAFAGTVAGMSGVLIVHQDGTGSRTLTLPAGSKVIDGGAGAITLTTTASAIDILTWVYDGTNYFWNKGLNYN